MTAHRTMTIIAFGSIGSFSPHLYGDDYRAGVLPFIRTGDERQQAVACAGDKCWVVIQRLCKQLLLKGQESSSSANTVRLK